MLDLKLILIFLGCCHKGILYCFLQEIGNQVIRHDY
jgi:hypothetical protein